MKISDEGIVVRVTKYRNTSLIGEIFSLNHGMHTLVLRGGGSKRNLPKSILFSIANILDFEAYSKPGQDLSYINNLKPNYHYHNLYRDIKKSCISMFYVECIRKTCKENGPQKKLYHFLKQEFIDLDTAVSEIGKNPIYFLANLSKHLGISPNFSNSSEDGIFNLYEGKEQLTNPLHELSLHGEKKRAFQSLFEYGEIGKGQGKFLLDTLLDYYAIHIPNFKRLKSPTVLRSVLK